MTRDRVDDRSGQGFLQALDYLRRRRRSATRRAAAGFETPLLWVPGQHDPRDAPVRTATAAAGPYSVFVAEMREAFMAGKPLHMPRISWAIFRGPGHDHPVVGAAAPSFEEAKARAELALRVQLGVKSDG